MLEKRAVGGGEECGWIVWRGRWDDGDLVVGWYDESLALGWMIEWKRGNARRRIGG